jgi:hypothetical protein
MAKKIRYTDIIGQRGINLIERVVLDIGYLWYPTNLEAGIDGIIEIRDPVTGIVTNSIIQVQSKATEQPFQAETENSFEYLCNERDLDYWINGNAPVILVRSRPSTNEAYWISIKNYFVDPARRNARKITFDKSVNRFDSSCKGQLASLAIPSDSGIYLSPLPRKELLASNLLPISSLPTHIYRASTDFRSRHAVWDKLRNIKDHPTSDWVLYEDAIISFHDLGEEPWTHISKRGSSKRGDTSGWVLSPNPTRQVFVQLLNRCLSEKVGRLGLRWSRNKECYFVRPSPNLSEKKFGRRTIFGPHMYKKDKNRIAYYRHSAFESQFYCFEREWYLEITPTYYYTRDGYYLDGFYEERLKGIKRLERNSAVIGQLAMWADFLCQQQTKDLFSEPYPFLQFGALQGFEVDFGIYDNVWSAGEQEDDSENDERLLF